MAKTNFFIILFILLGKCMPKVRWSLDLGINNGQWKIPSGFEETDYTNLGTTKEVANQVVQNSMRLQEMANSLEVNNTADQWTRLVMTILLVGTTIVGILVKIRGIKKGVSAVNNGLNSGGQTTVIPMHPVRGASPGYPSPF